MALCTRRNDIFHRETSQFLAFLALYKCGCFCCQKNNISTTILLIAFFGLLSNLDLGKFVQSYGFAVCHAWLKLGHSRNFCYVFKRLFSLLDNGIYATLRSASENELF